MQTYVFPFISVTASIEGLPANLKGDSLFNCVINGLQKLAVNFKRERKITISYTN